MEEWCRLQTDEQLLAALADDRWWVRFLAANKVPNTRRAVFLLPMKRECRRRGLCTKAARPVRP